MITVRELRKHLILAADELNLPLSVKQVGQLVTHVANRAARGPAPEMPITPHHYAVLVGLAAGEAGCETAARLGVSLHTVKSHRQRVYQALGATTGAHAVAIAHARGILRTAPAPKEREKDTSAGSQPAAGESTADFFQPGHTYQHGPWQFLCAAITTDPETGEKTAIGHFRFARGKWRLFSADTALWADGWTYTPGGGT